MVEVRVGCCGFAVRGGRKAYYERFDLVELQSTFYRLPMPRTAERWRAEAPSQFEFTVKCWQAITHPPTSPTWRKAGIKVEGEKAQRYGFLKPTQENFEAWERTKQICKLLDAKICVIQCPPSFNCTEENIRNMREFLQGIRLNGIRIAWEPRGDWKHHSSHVEELCREFNLIHVVDLLRYEPAYLGEVAYTRLHGLNPREYDYRYKYTDEDLNRLLRRVEDLERRGAKRIYVLFNNTEMADDAGRFKELLAERGYLPRNFPGSPASPE